MISIIVIIFVAWYVYKTAKENGRNGLLWAAMTVIAYFGSQILFSLLVGVLLGLGVAFFGWSEEIFVMSAFAIGIAAFVVSLGVVFIIYDRVSRVPEEKFNEPPPPPNFG